MMRSIVAGLVGLVVGAAAMIGLQQAPAGEPTPQRTPAEALPPPPAATDPPSATTSQLLLAWTSGGLPQSLTRRVGDLPHVRAVTVVRGGLAELVGSRDADGRVRQQLDAGFVVPLDVMAFDRRTYPRFLPASVAGAFRALDDDEVLLGTTSAALRGVATGGSLQLAGGQVLTVAGVVDDAMIGAAEIAVVRGAVDSLRPRYLLVHHTGDRAVMEEALRAAAPDRTAVRIRAPGETPYLRHGDAVLPQVTIKQEFGEFSYRPGAGRDFTQDPAWAQTHIVTTDVPVLGRVACHRAIIEPLRNALADLSQQGLGWLVDPDGYAGCYNPRLTGSKDGDSVSRHAWGVALDINAVSNPYGSSGNQDPRLIQTLGRWGFTWGGEWLVPDPAHFEYVGGPP